MNTKHTQENKGDKKGLSNIMKSSKTKRINNMPQVA